MPRVLETSQKRHVLDKVQTKRDLFSQNFTGHSSYVKNVLENVAPRTTASFGTVVEFDIPKNDSIGEMFLATTLGDATADYDDYVGLNMVKDIEIIQGSEDLQHFDYQPVMATVLSKLPEKASNQILALAGGAAFDNGVVITPIPCFWSKLTNYHKKDSPPFDLRGTNQKLTLRVRLRAAGDVETTPDGSITSMKLYYQSVSTDSPIRTEYSGNDWQSLEALDSAVVSGTETTSQLNVVGAINEIAFTCRLDSAITARDRFKNQDDLDELELLIDGKRFSNIEEKETSKYLSLIGSGQGATGTIGDPQTMVFHYYGDNHPAIHSGSLHMSAVNNLQLRYTHVAGAAATIGYAARTHSVWRIEGGRYHRFYD